MTPVLRSAITRPCNWLKLLAASIPRSLGAKPSYQLVLENSWWLVTDKFLRLCVQLITGVLVARYLGPEQFGQLSYAMALVSFFQTAANLGMDAVVRRDLARAPQSAGEVLATALGLKLASGSVCWCLAVVSILTLRGDDKISVILVGVMSSSMFFQPADVLDVWFQSQLQVRRSVLARMPCYLLSVLVRALLILRDGTLELFALAIVLDYVEVAVLLIASYRASTKHERSIQTGSPWVFSRDRAYQLLRDSYPLMLSNVAALIYMRVDQVLIREFVGQREVGFYSAILSLSEAWYTVPVVLCISVGPVLSRVMVRDMALYYDYLQKAFTYLTFGGVIVALVVSTLSRELLSVAYGSTYLAAAEILAVHVWAVPFVFLGIAQGLWIVDANKPGITLIKTAFGASVSIAGNLILIPAYGAKGAALVYVASQAVSCVISNAFVAPRIFRMQLLSVLPVSVRRGLWK